MKVLVQLRPIQILTKLSIIFFHVLNKKGNGFCTKGVYKSWKSCNDAGYCYKTCTDGLCHDEYKNKAKELEPIPARPCIDMQLKCARDCNSDKNCVGFSFRKIDKASYESQYECLLMEGTICALDDVDQTDPREVYHVKGAFINDLLSEFGQTTTAGLNQVIKSNDRFKFGHWSAWSPCWPKDVEKCGDGFRARRRDLNDDKRESEQKPCQFKTLDGSIIPCPEPEVEEEEEILIPHGWMEWAPWAPCSKTCNSRWVKGELFIL